MFATIPKRTLAKMHNPIPLDLKKVKMCKEIYRRIFKSCRFKRCYWPFATPGNH